MERKKTEKDLSEEDLIPKSWLLTMIKNAKMHAGNFINHTAVQCVMFFFTFYALLGDDLRLLLFNKGADNFFTNWNILTMSLFGFEVLLSSFAI